MKKFFFAAIAALAISTLFSSCAKEIITDDPFAEGVKDEFVVYDIDLQFDAPELAETTVFFFDEKGVQVNAKNISIPDSPGDVVSTSFLSESKPRYIYTPGLQNADADGYLTIPESTIETKAGGRQPVLLVIR